MGIILDLCAHAKSTNATPIVMSSYATPGVTLALPRIPYFMNIKQVHNEDLFDTVSAWKQMISPPNARRTVS